MFEHDVSKKCLLYVFPSAAFVFRREHLLCARMYSIRVQSTYDSIQGGDIFGVPTLPVVTVLIKIA
jgi:hypothetical protein